MLQARENLMKYIQTFLKKFSHLEIINEELIEYINSLSWNRPAFYNDDDDDEYSIQVSEFLKKSPITITPVSPTEEPDNSLSMGDEHLNTILEMELAEIIKSSVEDLILIPSESEDTSIVYSPKIDSFLEEFAGELAHIDPIPPGIDETDSDPKDDICFIEQLLYDDTLSEDDSFEDIDYVEASPLDSKLVSLEEVKDEILLAKLWNIHLIIDKIDDHTEDTCSGSSTTHADNFLLEYDSFHFEIEPDQGELSSIAMEAILGEPHVYVPNVLPTHPTLYQDLDFSSSDDSLGSETRLLIQGYSLKSNPRDFYLGILSPTYDCPDCEDSRARGFVHRPLDLRSFACLYLGIRYPRSY
nr:hypothetical protein [Tanacetum cinerariifolium]